MIFTRLLHETIFLFSREEKYSLGKKIENSVFEILELIVEAQYASKGQKVILLGGSSVKVDLLKMLFRLCFDLKLINQKKYLELEEKLQEIGRMLGGWLRSTKASF